MRMKGMNQPEELAAMGDFAPEVSSLPEDADEREENDTRESRLGRERQGEDEPMTGELQRPSHGREDEDTQGRSTQALATAEP
jgi:hypothetical protein